MTEYNYPGVYIEEEQGGPGPISGVSTSNLGLIGFSSKGPVDKPVLCTSFPDFVRKFGGFTADGLAPTMAYAFFANGGQRAYFVRVAPSDAVKAFADMNHEILAGDEEVIGNSVELSGIYSLQLDHPPVVPGSVVIRFNDGSADNVFTDPLGDGVLSATGGAGAGGTGAINYDTGEVSVTLNNPSDYAGGANVIDARYEYRVFRFAMQWPGIAGNYYRVRIVPGSSDFLDNATASYSRFTIFVDEDVNAGGTGGPSWVVRETFSDLVFDDIASSNFIVTVINNTQTGSRIISVVGYGNQMNPAVLQGDAFLAEDFSTTRVLADGSSVAVPEPYNGKAKGWKYSLSSGCFPKTLEASFKFQEGTLFDSGADDTSVAAAFLTDSTANWAVNSLIGMRLLNITDGSRTIVTANTATTVTGVLVGGSVNAWNSGDSYELRPAYQIGSGAAGPVAIATVNSPGSASAPAAIAPNSVVVDLELTTAGHVQLVDNGAGVLWDGVAGSAGTIDYVNGVIVGGQINVAGVTAWAADTIVAASAIYMQCDYATPVMIVDDGNGNLSLGATQAAGYPQKFTLDPSGINSINYDTGVFTVHWQLIGFPLAGPAGVTSETADYYSEPDSSIIRALTSGDDGSSMTTSDVVGPDLAVDQRGLYAFGQVDELMQLVVADFQTDVVTADALIAYAEIMKDKFPILTVPAGLTPQEAVSWKRFILNKYTSYAALYYPHIKILDPVTKVAVDVPCGGHVAGVYARTDSVKNVSKAPAGTEDGRLNWAVGLEFDLTPTQVGVCYPEKINCLVQWPHTGRCVWGARTLDIAGGEWPYIQMRRLFMFVEKSVFRSTHSHTFKNNGTGLWSAIRMQVSSFLAGLQQSGYFAGDTPDESFFVICDRTNNPENTVDQGFVFCDVGIAPTKPGEFIVFRFQQKAITQN